LGITNEAQNALLKTLEEPPANTIVLINGENKEDFLSTIISRCKVFEIKGDELLNDDFSAHVEEILNSGEGERLEIAEKFGKDRETAIKFVSQTVLKASELSKKENPKIYLSLLKNFNEAYGILKQSNVNPRLILENTLLSL
jgi:DNA polymerase III delta prime subunit